MNDILKQRLVGALILVALGVVFWPIIFVQPGDQPVAEQPRIPPSPAVDTTPIEPPDMAGLRPSPEIEAQQETVAEEQAAVVDLTWPVPVSIETESASAGQATARPVEKTAPAPAPEPEPEPKKKPAAPDRGTRTEAPEKLAMDSDGVPIAWILQVATVSNAESADALRERLLKVDQKAYVKRVKRDGKVLYRVYIGPKFERAALETIQPRINGEFGVKSMIARYVP